MRLRASHRRNCEQCTARLCFDCAERVRWCRGCHKPLDHKSLTAEGWDALRRYLRCVACAPKVALGGAA
jgi:hypothetical protein